MVGKRELEKRAEWKIGVRAEWPEPQARLFDTNMQKNLSKECLPGILLVFQWLIVPPTAGSTS